MRDESSQALYKLYDTICGARGVTGLENPDLLNLPPGFFIMGRCPYRKTGRVAEILLVADQVVNNK